MPLVPSVYMIAGKRADLVKETWSASQQNMPSVSSGKELRPMNVVLRRRDLI